MRSRSSRLFIVLVHVIGVSNHLPRGMLGVQPVTIILETFEVAGLDSLVRQDDKILMEPYWLQDSHDMTCLGPNKKFSECGDATIWFIRQRPQRKRRAKCVLFCDSLRNGYALEVLDQDKCLTKHLDLGPCHVDTAWSWRFNNQGALVYETGKLQRHPICLYKHNATLRLDRCNSISEDQQRQRRIQFSLVRTTPRLLSIPPILNDTNLQQETPMTPSFNNNTHIANTKDLAHSQASLPSSRRSIHQKRTTETKLLKATSIKSQNNKNSNKKRIDNKYKNIRTASNVFLDTDEDVMHTPILTKVRKTTMQPPNPYIAVAKNGIYTDPQTGLEYPTDLCGYLGETKQQSGRHTLMGVGQYTKTVFHIKVYGVALYVSKRDALKDPIFRSYASLSSDELKQRSDFYSHLRTMAGLVDRTLLLKLNMQLSTETMRSSLQADWKLLTEERKELLINSSMQPRPAQERMLQTILKPGNSGRCSCGQVAPEEYNADPSCCARGTELVFTWRKNGNLEVRLDGRVMDIFPRPDVAHGIFYEYLRYDAPISLDFKEHAVDGFPFLLAPLAQVRDLPTTSTTVPVKGKTGVGHLGRMTAHAGEFVGWVHTNANSAASNVINVAKSVGDSARGVAQEMERTRGHMWGQMVLMPAQGKDFLSDKIPHYADALAASMTNWLRGKKDQSTVISPFLSDSGPRRFVIRSSQWFREDNAIPDELPVIQATGSLGQQMFVWMVHLYLLLLLIVSLPGSNTTKLVTRKSFVGKIPFDNESDVSITSSSDEDIPCASPRRRDPEWTRDSQKPPRHFIRQRISPKDSVKNDDGTMKKSLSYFL